MRKLLFTLACFLILTILPFNGAIPLSSDLFTATIFWNSRVPRTICAFFAGGTLAVCGLALQSYFRNPLASPFTLGISSGGALGAIIGIAVFGISTDQALWFSFIGAGVTSLLVAALSRVSTLRSGSNFLIAGISLTLLLSNITILLQYLSDVSGLISTTRWMLGTVKVIEPTLQIAMATLCLITLFGLWLIRSELDLLTIGADFAESKGAQIKYTEWMLFGFTSLGVATVVAFCGPVGFVGIIEPYLARLLFGRRHHNLLPMTFLLGGVLLAVCDTIGRTAWAPLEIPAGLVVGVLGALAFLFIVLKKK